MAKIRSNFLKDISLVVILLIIPLLVHTHTIYEDEGNLINFFGINVHHDLGSNNLFIWLLSLKIVPLLFYGAWFITCYYNWKYYILLPIVIHLDSLVSFLLLNEYTYLSNFIYTTLSIVIIVSLLLFLNNWYLKRFQYFILKESLPELILSKQSEIFYLRVTNLIFEDQYRNLDGKKQLGHLQHLMNSLTSFLRGERESTLKPKLKKPFNKLAIISLILISLMFFIHHFIPEKAEIQIGIWSIGNYGFGNVNIFLWLFFVKFTLLLGMSVWFITNLEWWKYAILPGIILTSYQLYELFQTNIEIDSSSNFNTFPLLAIVLGILLLSIKKVNYKYKLIDIYNWLKKEIDRISAEEGKSTTVILKETLEKLKKSDNESELSAGLRLQRLLALKEEIQRQINKKD